MRESAPVLFLYPQKICPGCDYLSTQGISVPCCQADPRPLQEKTNAVKLLVLNQQN